jgi:hypothetical protein
MRSALPLLAATLALGGCLRSNEAPWELMDALPELPAATCVLADEREAALLELAVRAVELTLAEELSYLESGAERLLASGSYRNAGDKRVAVCVPGAVHERVGAVLNARGALAKGRLVEYNLALAARLPRANARIVEDVAHSAFNDQPQESDAINRLDIRPYARTVLAGFGRNAAPFAELAYLQMGIETPMSTGAAQVAAAAGHPQALARIDALMTQALAGVPAAEPVPRGLYKRLHELSWAIAFAGEAGKAHAPAVHQLMRRRVGSSAPPFGVVDLQPKRLCAVIERIEGPRGSAAYAYCADDKVPFEQ